MIKINWKNGHKHIEPTDDSYRFREIMGENNITLKFSLPEFIEFEVGAWVDFQSERYTLNTPQTLKKINEHHYDYTLILESNQALLHNFRIKDNTGRLKFPLTAKPSEYIELLVYNLNQSDNGWSVGECLDSAEKLVSFNHNSCREALQMIADAFNTEWEVVGKTINLKKVEYNKDNPLPLSYGKGNGFKSGIGRTNDGENSGFNFLFVQGGDRNIDPSKYGNKELLLPKNQQYTYEGETYYSSEDGLSIIKQSLTQIGNTYIDNTGTLQRRKEASLDLSHIYPKREGKVSRVVCTNTEKHFYDFTDSTIPESLDFSKCLINGQDLTVSFQSGMLSGREFRAKYKHSEREFEIAPEEQDGILMPDEIFKPAKGDKYAVFNMQMPNAYICDDETQRGASWEMFKEACKYFYENQDGKFTFSGEVDGIWAKKDWINIGGRLKVGGYVQFTDTKFQPDGILIRINSVKDYINNPHNPKIELSNSVQGKSLYSQIFKAKEVEVKQEDLHKKSIQYTKRQWRDTKETLKLLQGAVEGFGKGINPLTVETMSLLVGSENLQFVFVDSKTNPTQIAHNITFNNTKQLIANGGILQHKTLGIKTITTQHSANAYKYWDLPQFTSAVLDSDEPYFLYAKCSKSNQSGSFILSKTAIKMEQVSGYYHFLVGIANSEVENQRSFTTLYGFTEVLPGRITTDVIKSANNRLIIDLVNGEITGKVTFSNDSPAIEQVKAISETKAQGIINELNINSSNLLSKSEVNWNSKYKLCSTLHIGKQKGFIGMGGDFYFDNNRSNNRVRFKLFFTTEQDDYQNGDRNYVIVADFKNLQGKKYHHLFASNEYIIQNKHTHIKGMFCNTDADNVYPSEAKNLYITYSSKDLGYTPTSLDIKHEIEKIEISNRNLATNINWKSLGATLIAPNEVLIKHSDLFKNTNNGKDDMFNIPYKPKCQYALSFDAKNNAQDYNGGVMTVYYTDNTNERFFEDFHGDKYYRHFSFITAPNKTVLKITFKYWHGNEQLFLNFMLVGQ